MAGSSELTYLEFTGRLRSAWRGLRDDWTRYDIFINPDDYFRLMGEWPNGACFGGLPVHFDPVVPLGEIRLRREVAA